MTDINEIITKNFQENISYFELNHLALFEKLVAFESAVDSGHYQQKYELVYENENFDVLELKTGNYLYNKQTNKHAQKAQESIDFSTQTNSFETFFKQSFTDEALAFYKQEKEDNPLKHYASYVADIIQTTNINKSTTLPKIEKFIFFGAGLAEHIRSIDKKIAADVYLIVEDDLELFRLSLFCTNYVKLAQKATLFFAVFTDKEEFAKIAENFLNEKYYLNHYIKYFQMLNHSEEKTNEFYLAVASQADLKFLFHDYLLINTRQATTLTQGYNLLQKSLSFTKGSFNNKPFLLLASGPSLEKNIKWLQEHHDQFITLAVSSSLSFLESHNIKPNMVLHLDPFDPSINSFKKMQDIHFLDDVALIFAASSPKELFNMFNKEQIFLFEVGTNYLKNSLKLSAPCVGSLGYQFLLLTKVKEIYILGLDLAVDSLTGHDHTTTHQDTQKLQLKDVLNTKETLSYKQDLFSIKGNLQPEVFTTAHFFGSINIINHYFSQLKQPFQTIHNLSDGAYFTKSTPTTQESISYVDFQAKKHQTKLFKTLQESSSPLLKKEDLLSLQKRVDYAQDMLKSLKILSINDKTPKEYMQQLITLCASEEALKSNELARALESYLYYILNFIYFYITQEDRTQEEKENIHTLLINQIISLIDYYLNELQNSLEGRQCQ